MAYQLWSQDNFTKGELSPYMYARAGVEQYFNAMKTAQNVLTYPTGAAGKRFGTIYQTTLNAGITAANQIFFETFQYLDEAVYQLVFRPLAVDIYLEGTLNTTVVTVFDAQTVFNLTSTTLGSIFRVAAANIVPYDLTRISSGAVAISAVTAGTPNQFTLTTPPLQVGTVYPVRFTIGGTLTTSPQIKPDVTYFAFVNTTTSVSIYATSQEAKNQTNPFTLTSTVGANNIFFLTIWAITATAFRNRPVFDFNSAVISYDGNGFSASAVSGSAVTITVSPPYTLLTSAYVGGALFMSGGSAIITAVASTSSFTVAVQRPFDISGSFVPGTLISLNEPAWSNARGWPTKCSSYQNRAIFANTVSLPNGFWASVINDYADFANFTGDDDDAISWYPSSNNVNVIRFIVPFRSITVHTNTGIYSSPLSEVSAITPATFSLQLQDSTPATVLQPQAIDNQIIVMSGNDCHTMLWDGINNAYTSNIVSIVNEQTIRDPVDEVAFADLSRAGSRYVFIINANGSMAVYQTLIAEKVSGFTPQIMEQSYGEAQFRQAASSANGRCWFVSQRQIASAAAPIVITAFTSDTLTAVASNLSTTVPIAITFTTVGTLPASTPALAVQTYYWALGVTANTFKVYGSQEDAEADENAYEFTSAGTSSNLVSWPLATIFTLEELSQDVKLDCAVYYNSTPTSTVTTGTLFNGQEVKMVGDGFGFDAIGVNNQVTFEAHGEAVNISTAYIGFPINLVIEPMPIALPKGDITSLTKPTHIRSVRFMFNNTIGGTINGVPIALNPFNQANIGDPPSPSRGIFEMMLMSGWDDNNQPSFTIEHNDPFNIELIGIFYSIDV